MAARPKPQHLSLLIAGVDGTLVDENKILTDTFSTLFSPRLRRFCRLG